MWFLANVQTILGLTNILSSLNGNIPTPPTKEHWDDPKVITAFEFPERDIEGSFSVLQLKFPQDFYFGVSTSAYLIEGGWNANGKGESVWDAMTHSDPTRVVDQSNADIAADSYNKFYEDVALAKSIGSNMYRISLSWTRILPNGFDNYINRDGIRYYNDVINEMLDNGIEPMITLFYMDLPNVFQKIGGWTNSLMPEYFEAYARVAFAAFGDRVKYWVTVNEPGMICEWGYASTTIPGLNQSGIADYLCGHYLLIAHARAYRLYEREFRKDQQGKVGMVTNYRWFVPNNWTNTNDYEATELAYSFYNDWFLYPILKDTADYPEDMRTRVAFNSYLQGFSRSRLPTFTEQEAKDLKGSVDFLGLNFFSAVMVHGKEKGSQTHEVSFRNDVGVKAFAKPPAPSDASVTITPWALGRILHRLISQYPLPDVFITENGYSDYGQIYDIGRASYYHQHIWEVLKMMRNGNMPVKGYLAWSLIDSFSWTDGYSMKFGLFSVDFNDTNRPRTPKFSTSVIKDIYMNRKIKNLYQIIGEEHKAAAEKYYVPHEAPAWAYAPHA